MESYQISPSKNVSPLKIFEYAKIETQKAADQAVLETKTLLKSLSVSKAAYSKMYFWLMRLPTDVRSFK